MSKIKPDKINFNRDDFIVEINENEENPVDIPETENEISKQAYLEAEKIVNSAEDQRKTIINEAQDILSSAKEQAQKLIDDAESQKQEMLNSSKEEIEKQKTDSANLGYQEGYQDGETKLYEEFSEKIETFDKFCSNQYEIKNKILKSASKDILDIILNISKKVLLKEVDGKSLEKIIQKTILLFEKKENITIILSEKYARLLFEFQKKSFNNDIEFNFEDFKQYDNFEIMYNSKLPDDTIIIENQKERFDSSISSQLDVIIRDIFENTLNGQIEDIEQYGEDETQRFE